MYDSLRIKLQEATILSADETELGSAIIDVRGHSFLKKFL
jgi:hypothetical protein